MAFPADTVWGLGASAASPEGLEKLRKIKGRGEGHPFPVYIASEEALFKLAHIESPELVRAFTKKFWPGSLTIVLPLKKEAMHFSGPSEGSGALGFRVPDSEYLRLTAGFLNAPLANTSANLTGQPVFENGTDIKKLWEKQLDILVCYKDTDKTLSGKNLLIKDNRTIPSTVIGIENGGYVIFREGQIKRSALDTIPGVVKR